MSLYPPWSSKQGIINKQLELYFFFFHKHNALSLDSFAARTAAQLILLLPVSRTVRVADLLIMEKFDTKDTRLQNPLAARARTFPVPVMVSLGQRILYYTVHTSTTPTLFP